MKNKQAFSIIEILMSLAIISILFAIAIPSFASKQNAERDFLTKEEVHNVILLQERYFANNKDFINLVETESKGIDIKTPSGTIFQISNSHKLKTNKELCDNGLTGLYVKVSYINNIGYEYNSCTTKKIIKVLS